MATEKARAEMSYTAKGLDTLSKVGNAITGVNQALELMRKGMRVVTAATEAFIDTGSKIEQWEGQFATLTGSMEKAQAKMEALSKFASRAPFQLPDIIEASVQLEAFGLGAEKHLQAAGDMAAGFGRDLNEAVQAMSSAAAGMMIPLKRWGITVYDIRQQIGHELVRDTKEGLREISEAVTELFQKRTAGAMEGLAATLQGKISMLQDAWFRFKRVVADAEMFETVKEIFGTILDTVNELFETGKAERLGKVIGETLADVMWTVARALARAADALLTIVNVVKPLLGILGKPYKEFEAIAGHFDPYGGRAPGPETVEAMVLAAMERFEKRWLKKVAPRASAFGLDLGVPADYAAAPERKPGRAPGLPGMALPQYGVTTYPHGERGMTEQEQADLYEEAYDYRREVLDSFDEYEAEKQREKEEREAQYLGHMSVGWDTYYSHLMEAGKKYAETGKKQWNALRTAAGEGVRAMFADWAQVKGREYGIMAMEQFARGVGALFTNPPAAATHFLAAAKWTALGTALGVGAGMVMGHGAEGGAYGGGGDMAGAPEGAVEPDRSDGTRSITRSTGVVRQTLNIVNNFTFLGPAVFGPGGWEELTEEVIVPAMRNAVATGDI